MSTPATTKDKKKVATVRFVDALPERKRHKGPGRGPSKEDVAFLEELKVRPGVFAVYKENLPSARASQLGTAIRKGKRAAFRDLGLPVTVEVIEGCVYVRIDA